MTIIDADKFLAYLIFSKHIDGLTCGEVKEAIEMCKVDEVKVDNVLDKIKADVEQNAYPIVHGVNNHELGMTLYGILQVIDKYKAESEDKNEI
jgi:hypothetical protein